MNMQSEAIFSVQHLNCKWKCWSKQWCQRKSFQCAMCTCIWEAYKVNAWQKWKCKARQSPVWKSWTHAQAEACTCSTESMHMLNWKYAHAHLKVCTCLNESMDMLNWKCAHAQLKTCTYSTKMPWCSQMGWWSQLGFHLYYIYGGSLVQHWCGGRPHTEVLRFNHS